MLLAALALLTATPATIGPVLARAKPGDTVRLTNGDYGRVLIEKRQFDPPLILDAGDARLQLVIFDSAGIEVSGGTLTTNRDLTVINGSESETPANWAGYVRDSQRIGFTGSTFTGGVRGLMVSGSGFVTLRDLTFTDLRSDGINIPASHDVLIDGVTCRDFSPIPAVRDAAGTLIKDGDHPDCVQSWNFAAQPAVYNVTVRNVVGGAEMQCVFFSWHPAQGGRADDRIYRNITLENNQCRDGLYPRGVSLTGAEDSIVRGNRVSTGAAAKWQTNVVVERCERCIVSDNIVEPMPAR